MTSPAEFNEAIAKLRDRFAATAGNTTQAFLSLADQLQRAPGAPEVVDALRRELHRLHGTAGSYGFHEVSRLASSLELVTARWQADPQRDREQRPAIVQQFSRALAQAFKGPADGASAPASRMLLVDVPDELAAGVVAEATLRGYAVERTGTAGLEALLDHQLPDVVVAGGAQVPPVPDTVPLVLIGHDQEPGSAGSRVRFVDSAADASEVVRVAESLAAQTGMAGATMLVVDDDPAMLELLRAIGESEGMFVHTLQSAEALEAALERERPAIVLLDADLPGIGGVEALRRLRRDRRHRELPVVLVSASLDAAVRAAAFTAGADDFQPKPVVASELTRRLVRLLEVRKQRQVARGIHPATSLSLPERTVRQFDEALVQATEEGRPMSLAVLRPRQAPAGVVRTGLWYRECQLVAAALGVDGARCGFLDETALGVLLPMAADAAVARLDSFAEASEGEPVAWCAGVAEQTAGEDRSARTLALLAEEAWQSARDGGARLHRWDDRDAGIAPDVVLVEDDEALADLVGYALASRGLTHVVYSKGPDALAGLLAMKVRGRRPVVLMDVDLPGLDGFSLFERLRVERPRDFRVVFVTVHASEGEQLRALRAGALDYLVKPVSLRVLMAKIGVWRAQDDAA